MNWKQAYRNRLVTVADVDKEIDRVKDELAAASAKVQPVEPWQEKLSFLSTVRADLSTGELPFIGIAP